MACAPGAVTMPTCTPRTTRTRAAYVGAREAPRAPYPHHRQGRCSRAGAGAARCYAQAQGGQGLRRARQAVLAGSGLGATRAATSAGRTQQLRRAVRRCAVQHVGRARSAVRSRRSTATTSSISTRSRPGKGKTFEQARPRARGQLRRDRAPIDSARPGATAEPARAARCRSSTRSRKEFQLQRARCQISTRRRRRAARRGPPLQEAGVRRPAARRPATSAVRCCSATIVWSSSRCSNTTAGGEAARAGA